MISRLKWLPVLIGFALPAFGAEVHPWRAGANQVLGELGTKIEVLDESLHEAYENHSSEAFKKAIEVYHHIEGIVTELREDVLTLPFKNLCQDFHHIYEDLVQIRLDLISLGIEYHPKMLYNWNSMIWVYNNRVNPYFYQCPADPHDPHEHGYRSMTLLPLK